MAPPKRARREDDEDSDLDGSVRSIAQNGKASLLYLYTALLEADDLSSSAKRHARKA